MIAPFYDPIRLAEDLVVLDHLSRGRVDVVVAGGYVHEEFALYGVPMRERGARVTEAVATLKAAFTGAPFEFRGRTVQVTPAVEQGLGADSVVGDLAFFGGFELVCLGDDVLGLLAGLFAAGAVGVV